MKTKEILSLIPEAIEEEGFTFGHPEGIFQQTAMLFSAYLQTPIHDYQVPALLMLAKLAKTNQLPLRASAWVELSALAAIAGESATEESELYA